MSTTLEHNAFHDVIDHPWVEQYRLPVLEGDWYPTFFYFVTVAVPPANADQNLFEVAEPTEDEAKLLSLYLDYRIDVMGFRAGFVEKMRERKLDVVPGISTLSFVKFKDSSWHYRRSTWTQGPSVWPGKFNEHGHRYENLADLLARVSGTADELDEQWLAYKDAHESVGDAV
jgi:hypothetical protein